MTNIVKSGNGIDIVGAIVESGKSAIEPIDERMLVRRSVELTKAKAEIETELKINKATFFKLADERVGEGQPYTLYSPEDKMKLARQVSMSGGGTVSSEDMLIALCEYFGEAVTDKTGNAWRVFKKISDEPVVIRTINTDKLADFIQEMQEVEGGMRKASKLSIPSGVLTATISRPSIRESFNPKAMTKAEIESIG